MCVCVMLYGQLADRPTRRQLNWQNNQFAEIEIVTKIDVRFFWTHGRVFFGNIAKKLATRCRCDYCQQRRRHGHNKDGTAKLR